MLYSQNPDYVFDLTYACNEATELYRNFMTVILEQITVFFAFCHRAGTDKGLILL